MFTKYDKIWLITMSYNGFCSLVGRVFDCELKDVGSIPIENP